MTIFFLINHSTSKLFNENWVGTVDRRYYKNGTQIYTDLRGLVLWERLPAAIKSRASHHARRIWVRTVTDPTLVNRKRLIGLLLLRKIFRNLNSDFFLFIFHIPHSEIRILPNRFIGLN